VHGLLLDIGTGKVDWLVNGYETLDTLGARLNEAAASAGHTLDALKSHTDFEIGGIKFPETKIGETVTKAEDWLSEKIKQLESKPPPAESGAKPPAPPRIPLPPPLRPKLRFRKGPK